jgi:glycosyltransferase involved in cell wall biosynthesis
VGRLAPNKNVDVLISAVAELQRRGIAAECVIVGDGPERGTLEAIVERHGLEKSVQLTGALPFDEAQEWYERADALVLASDAEGWPKAIAEAMAFGLVCVGSDRGFTRRMLADGRGILVQPRDLTGLADLLADVARHPERYDDMRARASLWAQQYSLEGLRRAIGSLLRDWWGVDLEADPQPARERVAEPLQ